MNLNELLSQIPMDQIAQQLGVSTDEATKAAQAALPALVHGMQANAQDPGGAASLAGALDDHAGRLSSGGLDVENVDVADGQKIVGNVFGGNTEQVINQLGGLGGLNSGLISKLLPMLAPIVMGWLGNKFKQGGSGGSAGSAGSAGGGIGGWLSDILGGGGGDATPTPAPADTTQSPAPTPTPMQTPADGQAPADTAPADTAPADTTQADTTQADTTQADTTQQSGGSWISDVLGGLLGGGKK